MVKFVHSQLFTVINGTIFVYQVWIIDMTEVLKKLASPWASLNISARSTQHNHPWHSEWKLGTSKLIKTCLVGQSDNDKHQTLSNQARFEKKTVLNHYIWHLLNSGEENVFQNIWNCIKNDWNSRSLSPGTVSVEDVVTITVTVVVVGLRIRITWKTFLNIQHEVKKVWSRNH